MKRIFAIAAVAALTGCSSNPIKKAHDYNVELAGSDKIIEVEKTPAGSFTFPAWYLSQVITSDGYISVSGSDISNDATFAIDKAMNNARREIAIFINSTTSNVAKDYKRDYHNSDSISTERVTTHAQRVTSPNVRLGGIVREKVLVRKEGNYYRAFVRVTMPLRNANSGQPFGKSSNSNNLEKESEKAFKDMQ